jgi:Na+-translocating ferredoxin:NAD+ oxidoreductase RNF subunit RnfB
MPIWLFIIWAVAFFFVFFIGTAWLANMAMAWAGRHYGEKTKNEALLKIEKMLPGKNCGECGCETCKQYAAEVFYGRADENRCPYGKESLPEDINKVVGEFLAFLDSAESIDQIKKEEKERRFKQ